MTVTTPRGIILGFDPGGIGNFGWSVCEADSGGLVRLETGLADDAEDAHRRSLDVLGSRGAPSDLPVLAAGIDAPMFWSMGGGREADGWLRKALRDTGFGTPGGTVQEVNSLRGACLAQGVLLGRYLRKTQKTSCARITEAHPKALEHLLDSGLEHSDTLRMVRDLTEGLGNRTKTPGKPRHERDATLCAVAAWAMISGLPGWRNLYLDEPRPVQPFCTPVAYWMPEPPTSHSGG